MLFLCLFERIEKTFSCYSVKSNVYKEVVELLLKIKQNGRPIGIDLFAGAGGMSLGFEKAGFDIVASVELDPIHCAVHEYNFPKCKTICADVSNITGQDIRKQAKIPDDLDIDIVFGGAPCQGFSMIGKRALEDPRNSLVYHYVRLIKELKPKYFVFENVKGLTVGKHKKFLEEIMDSFEGSGFHVVRDYKVLNALDFGVPQSRERLFLLGWRSDMNEPTYPEPTHNKEGLNDLPKTPTVEQAIGDLPYIEENEELFEKDSTGNIEFKEKSEYAQRMSGASDKNDYGYHREFDKSVLTSSLRTKHTEKSIVRFAQTEPGKTEKISRFLKLDPNGYCNTLRAGTASDRGAHTSPRPINPYVPRCITNREAMRLHSYPDWFRVHSTKWHGFRQIGNSVPPLLAKAIGLEIMKSLGRNPSKPKRTIVPGDEKLLSYNMSEASEMFGVSKDVIPQRQRKVSNG
jgi:DNA (cytosine-5)-methyltransferase 1